METGNFKYIKELVLREYSTYSGIFLEKLFHELIAETLKFNEIGNYWERGNANEIDLVAVNETGKKMLIAEIKMNPKRIDVEKLKRKAEKLASRYRNFEIEYRGLSLKNVDDYLES